MDNWPIIEKIEDTVAGTSVPFDYEKFFVNIKLPLYATKNSAANFPFPA